MLDMLLTRLVEHGTLTVIWPNGKSTAYGTGGRHATIRFHGWSTVWAVGLRPELGFGEAYMDGRMSVEEGTITDVLEIVISNMGMRKMPTIIHFARALRRSLRWFKQFNPASRARRNVAHHYDLSGELYDLFLDSDRQYSCAYFKEPKMTLEAAQAAK